MTLLTKLTTCGNIVNMSETEISQDEFDAQGVARVLLEAAEVYETLTGELLDPSHPNALKELRRIATAKYFVRASWSNLYPRERKIASTVIANFVRLMGERYTAKQAA